MLIPIKIIPTVPYCTGSLSVWLVLRKTGNKVRGFSFEE